MLFGDFNIDLLTPGRTKADCMAAIQSSGMKVINKIDTGMPTRPDANTIIDHVIMNHKNDSFVLSLIEDDISDHNIIILEINKERESVNEQRTYTDIDYKILIEKLSNEAIVIQQFMDINTQYASFLHQLQTKIESATKMGIFKANNLSFTI